MLRPTPARYSITICKREKRGESYNSKHSSSIAASHPASMRRLPLAPLCLRHVFTPPPRAPPTGDDGLTTARGRGAPRSRRGRRPAGLPHLPRREGRASPWSGKERWTAASREGSQPSHADAALLVNTPPRAGSRHLPPSACQCASFQTERRRRLLAARWPPGRAGPAAVLTPLRSSASMNLASGGRAGSR
jgi:hypothetical protein